MEQPAINEVIDGFVDAVSNREVFEEMKHWEESLITWGCEQ